MNKSKIIIKKDIMKELKKSSDKFKELLSKKEVADNGKDN